jgi:hypothetical protein
MSEAAVWLRAAPEHSPELLPLDAGEQYRFTFAMDSSWAALCGWRAEQNGLPPAPPGAGWASSRRGSFTPAVPPVDVGNHCLDPACLTGCPTNAYVTGQRRGRHADDCIGCQYAPELPYRCRCSSPTGVVTKCDSLPRLEEGLKPGARLPHSARRRAGERGGLGRRPRRHAPPAARGLGPSTTRIALPGGGLAGTVAPPTSTSTPNTPLSLVMLTLLTQVALGVSLLPGTWPSGRGGGDRRWRWRVLLHLGRPIHAWKAPQLRRSCREAAAGAYAGLARGEPALAPRWRQASPACSPAADTWSPGGPRTRR